MNNQSSMTALMSAFSRAWHAEHEKAPVFRDDLAKRLMTDEEYAAIKGYILSGADFFYPDGTDGNLQGDDLIDRIVSEQLSPTPLARAALCEATLLNDVRTGAEQIVLLGAGLDTFILRQPGTIRNLRVFEVDHPLTQADKRARIDRAGLTVPDNVAFTAADFEKDDLKSALIGAGFDRRKKTFFSWLGMSYYLSRPAIEAMLDDLADLAAPGSTLFFDYADEGLFTSNVPRVKNMLAMAQAGGEGMKSCFSERELEQLLDAHRFLIYELSKQTDIQRRVFDKCGSKLTAFEHICCATAVLTHPLH